MSFTGDFIKSATAVNGSTWLTALVALIPILFFFWALAIKKMKGYKAGISTLLVAMVLSIFLFKMPVMMAVSFAAKGAFNGFMPIGWIILFSVFLYKLVVKAGQFEIIKDSIVGITEDRRLQAVLIAFCFGAFLEGAAGFGAPVAITAALLIGLGFKPLRAAGLCLIANTAPVAFGALGAPVIAFGTMQINGVAVDANHVAAIIGRILPFISVFIPIFLVWIMVGFKKMLEVIPALLVAGGSFALVQFASSNFIGAELPDIVSSVASIVCLVIFLKLWKPKNIYRFEDTDAPVANQKKYSTGAVTKAWSPFIILTAMVTVWSIPALKAALGGTYVTKYCVTKSIVTPNGILKFIDQIGAACHITLNFPFINGHLINALTNKPMTNPDGTPFVYSYGIDYIVAAGTAILITAIITKYVLKISWGTFVDTFGQTVKEVFFPLVTISAVVAYSEIANQSGMVLALGTAIASTGVFFKFLSPVLGWLGVFVTGSDTSANLLFGGVQLSAAPKVAMDQYLALAANTAGGVTGKMISPQSIAVAAAAVGLVGRESELVRFTVKYSLILLFIVCCIVFLESNVLSFLLP